MSSVLDATISLTPLATSIQELASAAKRANDEAKVKTQEISLDTKGKIYMKSSFSYQLMLWHTLLWSTDTDGEKIYR